MFQWSSNRRSTTATAYPGQRTTNTVATTAPAYTIQGSIRPPELTRAQHLESFLQDETLKRSTRRIPPGDSTYDTVFQTVNGDTLILRVDYPEGAGVPVLTLAGVQARHSWLDTNGMRVVGYGPLQNATAWRDSRILLGVAVHQVVQELQVRPPEIVQIFDAHLQKIQKRKQQEQQQQQIPASIRSPAALASTNASLASSSLRRGEEAPPDYSAVLNVPSVDMPAIPSRFEELDSLDREQLDRLLSDELEFLTFCNKLPIVRTLHTMATSVVDDNAATAEKNLKHEKELKELYEKAKNLQAQLKVKVREFQEMERKQDKLCRPPDKRKVVRELAKAKKESFDQSERLADEWIEQKKGAAVEDFVTEFLKLRKVHHVRAAKLELLELAGR